MAGSILDCYDAELGAFVDELAGDFDFPSTMEREAWLVRQWTQVAEAGGWADPLAQTLASLRRSRLGLVSIESAAAGAFSSWIRREREDEARQERATVRAQVLETIAARQPANLWRVEVDVGSLPAGVCYGRGLWRPVPSPLPMGGLSGVKPGGSGLTLGVAPAGGGAGGDAKAGAGADANAGPITLPQRTFLADAGPSYFWTPTPTTLLHHPGCGWQTPLRLSLGTYPWVYGHRLQAPAPGLSWRSNSQSHPAVVAMRIAAGLWHESGNLQQDAREVASHWKQWRSTTAPLVRALPVSAQVAGTLYRDGERLRVFQGSEELAGVNGPRGFVSAAAFNFVQGRFAAFFAMRRALLRARRQLTPELRDALIANPDPCLRQQLGVAQLKLA